MAAGGCLGTTGPASGLKTTGLANASWIGPRVRTSGPFTGVGGGGG